MNSATFQILELSGVGIIVCIQLWVFFTLISKIARLRGIFPEPESFKVKRPEDLLDVQGGNATTRKIIESLNKYLTRNRGIASDFHLIKDIVERHVDSLESDINQSITVPLYLGLLGTFLGIVYGLFQISGAINDQSLPFLLNGVKIAMISSFSGLFLTVLNSGRFYKGARAITEERKNDFYTFIQVELLPLLNQNINATLYSLQANLHKFNEQFGENLDKLSSVMGRNYEALVAQERILNTLETIDISAFAQANVRILHELRFSVEHFTKFNEHLSGISQFVQETRGFTGEVHNLVEKSGDLSDLARKISATFSESRSLMEFLQNHYTALDTSHQLITESVNRVADTLRQSLERLDQFTREKITAIQDIMLHEMTRMQGELPERWRKLDYLETISKDIAEHKSGSAGNRASQFGEMKEINRHLDKALEELEAIRQVDGYSLGARLHRLFSRRRRQKKTKEK